MYELCTRVSACALMCVCTDLHEGRAMLGEVAPRGLVGGTLLPPHPRGRELVQEGETRENPQPALP